MWSGGHILSNNEKQSYINWLARLWESWKLGRHPEAVSAETGRVSPNLGVFR